MSSSKVGEVENLILCLFDWKIFANTMCIEKNSGKYTYEWVFCCCSCCCCCWSNSSLNCVISAWTSPFKKSMCVIFLLIPWLSKKLSHCRIWDSIAYFPGFTVGYRLKSMNGVYKTDIDCSLIRGMVENYCTLGKIQPFACYSPRP